MYPSTPGAPKLLQYHPISPELRDVKRAPQKITLSLQEQGNVGHCNTGGNSVHTHNLFLYYL